MNDSEKTLHLVPPQRIQQVVVFAVAMLGLFLLFTAIGAAQKLDRPDTPASNTVTVSGTGTATVAPDIAHITFSVTHSAATVADAQAATTKQANAALDYVKGQGIADKDVKTLSYNISPQYSYPNPCPPGSACPMYYGGSPKITGYEVSETVQITVRDLDKVGTLLGGLGSQNVQNISGPDFALENPMAGQNAARTEAIKDAKAQAKELAKELGVHLVRIVNFSEGGNYPIYAKAYDMAASGAPSAPTPQVPAGENQFTSNVSITYEIR